MFFSTFLLAKAVKHVFSRQRYCFFRIYARARAHFPKKKIAGTLAPTIFLINIPYTINAQTLSPKTAIH